MPSCEAAGAYSSAEAAALLDEFGELFCEVEALHRRLRPKRDRLDELKPRVEALFPDLPADQATLARGIRYKVAISKRFIEKKWTSMDAVQRAVGGWRRMRAICTVTFKAVADKLGNSAAEQLQSEFPTGSRRVTASPIVSPPCERVLDLAEAIRQAA